MPSYQIRFVGEGAPEPETLIAAGVGDVLQQARSRLAGRAGLSAMVMLDGWLVTTVEAPLDDQHEPALDDPRFASAGIYVLG